MEGFSGSRDPITAVAAAPHMLLIGRTSGEVLVYTLPDLVPAGKLALSSFTNFFGGSLPIQLPFAFAFWPIKLPCTFAFCQFLLYELPFPLCLLPSGLCLSTYLSLTKTWPLLLAGTAAFDLLLLLIRPCSLPLQLPFSGVFHLESCCGMSWMPGRHAQRCVSVLS